MSSPGAVHTPDPTAPPLGGQELVGGPGPAIPRKQWDEARRGAGCVEIPTRDGTDFLIYDVTRPSGLAALVGELSGRLEDYARAIPPDGSTEREQRLAMWLWWIGKYSNASVGGGGLYVLTQAALAKDSALPPPMRPDGTWMIWREGVEYAAAYLKQRHKERPVVEAPPGSADTAEVSP